MRKLLLLLIIICMMTGCSPKSEHDIAFTDGKRYMLFDEYDCVAVFTRYTNDSRETAVPADCVTIKAFQNGVELSPLVPTGEKIEGYSQCDSSVQSGVTADIVWFSS